jgi:hypothetical protein
MYVYVLHLANSLFTTATNIAVHCCCLLPCSPLQIFGKLMEAVDEAELSAEEAKERKIMKLLLKVKNGTPPQRKSALRQLTEKARDFGAKALFDQILPLLMTPTLEDQERHLLVKVIDRCGVVWHHTDVCFACSAHWQVCGDAGACVDYAVVLVNVVAR